MPIDNKVVREAEVECACIAPLSQSRHGDMACETLYVRKHIEHTKVADSEPAARARASSFTVAP
jgi:hypothetical protein